MIDTVAKKMLDISIALSSERDDEALLERILNVAMDITSCDAGTLYIKKGEKLHFSIMITKSMGGKLSAMNMPPVCITPTNVCARAIIDGRVINISDVAASDEFDFAGPKRYDEMTGYKTKSMLVIPMEDNTGNRMGVLQLINAIEDGCIVPFKYEHEIYISALTSQAAICLVKMNHSQEVRGLLDSLVRALSMAIHERTPYNVTHTRNMEKYADKFITWLNETDSPYKFSKQKRREFLMAVQLHDVGKLTVPLEVMNKESRLSSNLERVLTRFQIIDLSARLGLVEDDMPYEQVKELLKNAKHTICEVNSIPFLTKELEDEILKIARLTYIDDEGIRKNWLTEAETEALCIKKGTLTAGERKRMEEHVVMTGKILAQVKFGSEYSNVARWATDHHEFVDGSGYARQMKDDEVSWESRLLTIIDVYDGLSAVDRPYKKPIPVNVVFRIMKDMVSEGKLDADILNMYEISKAWEKEDERNV